jgi:hypothetical protein
MTTILTGDERILGRSPRRRWLPRHTNKPTLVSPLRDSHYTVPARGHRRDRDVPHASNHISMLATWNSCPLQRTMGPRIGTSVRVQRGHGEDDTPRREPTTSTAVAGHEQTVP